MIFKNLTALCRANKCIMLYGAPDELQWVSEGHAIYPLHGHPGMTANMLPRVFDVPEKDLGKYYIRHNTERPAPYDYSDVALNETQLRPEQITIKRGDMIMRPARTSKGLMFYDPEYLKPLRDVQDSMGIYERRATDGTMYFAVKSGMLLQALILPLAPDYGKLLEELLGLCEGLQKTVESVESAGGASHAPTEETEIEGQMEMEGEV